MILLRSSVLRVANVITYLTTLSFATEDRMHETDVPWHMESDKGFHKFWDGR